MYFVNEFITYFCHCSLESPDCNFPRVFKVWFVEQAREIARRCVQRPLKPRPSDPPFEPRPSLRPVLKFLVDHVKRYPSEVSFDA